MASGTRVLRRAAAAAVGLGWLVLLVLGPGRAAAGGDEDEAPLEYVGSEICASCHQDDYARWSQSSHAHTFEAVDASNLPGDVLGGETVQHPPGRTTFRNVDGRFEAVTVGPDGKPFPYHLTHVVGRMRVRMFVATLPDGRMQVLPSMLEVPTGSWFDYTDLMFGAGGTDWNKPPVVKPGDASFWTGPVRSWDARCARCHTTDWKPRRPDAHGKGPRGTSLALGVGCEACHGPGSRHVDFREAKKAGDDPILHYAQLARSRAMGMCLQCHMEGEVVDPHFRVGDDVFEARDPILLVSPELIDPSGRPLELIYDGVPFATSRCAQKGKLTCISCHDPHGTRFAAQLRQAPSDDRMCTRCHVTLGKDPKAHTHHDPGGPGGRCVNCHMPFLTIERGHGVIADHSISTPRYDLHADRAATPACTWCHAGKRDAPSGAPTLPEAALRKAHARWYGTRAAAKPWMQALGAARLGEPDAWKALVRTLGDHDLPRVVRASAAELLGRYAASAPLALLAATHDEDSLVRRRAVAALADLHGEAVDRRLREALDDPSRAVRMAAARAALEGWKRVQADRALLKAILPVLRADAEAVPEDDMRWFRLGAARGLAGDEAGALEAYERELELDPFAGHVRQTVARLKKKLGR